VHVRNRLVFPPVALSKATPQGDATDYHRKHYARIAAAGVGLVIVEHSYVSPEGRMEAAQLALDDDARIDGLATLAKVIRAEGASAAIQLAHAGPKAQPAAPLAPVGPSAVQHPAGGPPPCEMATAEVEALVECFVSAAKRAVAAGFEVVEIHAAHGFLLSCFLSPLTNRRTDAYGGDLDRRVRAHVEITRAVRAAVGGGVAVIVRLGVDDRLPGGVTLDEGVAAASRLVEAGADAIDVSGGLCGSRPADLTGQGFFVPHAEAVKRRVKVPVIGVGGVTEAAAARRFVLEGRVDAVAVGRHLVAHPEWAREVLG